VITPTIGGVGVYKLITAFPEAAEVQRVVVFVTVKVNVVFDVKPVKIAVVPDPD